MADFRIRKFERSIVERSNLRITKIRNKNWEAKASKLIYIKGQVWEIASSVEYQMDKKFQNLLIFGAKFRFSKFEKNVTKSIFKIVNFWNFLNFTISKIIKFLKFLNF